MSDLAEFRTLRQRNSNTPSAVVLAKAIQQQIEQMLSAGEMVGAEALMLQKELLTTAHADTVSRDKALAQWKEQNKRFFTTAR